MRKNSHFSEFRIGTVTRWLIFPVIAVLAILLILPFVHWHQQKNTRLSVRPDTQHADTVSPRRILSGLRAYYQLNDREHRPATLHLSLDELDLTTLTARRDDALSQGWITSKHKQQLPAVLDVNGRRMNASVRLRGNQPDHVSGEKWSLKVYLKQGARFNGMRRFSLQAPYTRSFQSEAIIADAMRSVGVLAPRIDYVDLVINDKKVGIMQLTEAFDTPLLESQGRRFGPLLQLDDAHTWEMVRTTERHTRNGSRNDNQQRDDQRRELVNERAWWSLFSNWRSATPKAYGKYGKRKKGEDLNAALSQWMAFTSNQVSPSDIFDIDAFVDFYIMCEYFTAHNLAQWMNARLHYNTLTARFEPIAYDADLHFKPMHDAPLTCLNPRNNLARTLMHDPVFARQWANRIGALDAMVTSDKFADFINARDAYYRQKLAADYPWLPSFDFSRAQRQCRRLCGLGSDDFAPPSIVQSKLPDPGSIPLNELPAFVKAYAGEDENGSFLTLHNRIHSNVVVSHLAYENRINEQIVPLIGRGETDLPGTRLPLTLGSGSVAPPADYTANRIDLAGTALTDEDRLSLQIEIDGLGTQQPIVQPLPWPQPVTIPGPTPVENLLQRYAFLTLDETGKVLRVAAGRWQLDDLVVIPRGIALIINAGTQLLFTPNAGLVLNGDLTVRGEAAAPVIFDATEQTSGWRGIFSHGAGNQLSVKHATINATRGFEIPGWRQPAGLFSYRTNVVLENVAISNSCADDAINLIRSTIDIKDVQVTNSCKDAIDIDASTGTLSDLNLQQSGGDLLDFSDSAVTLGDSVFSGAGDKAISVGEASDVEISDVTITDSVIGLAAKDFSEVKITRTDIASVDIGLMAFQKKAEYGPATVAGSDLNITAAQQYVLEQRSRIALDGRELTVTPFDLTDFY